MADYGLQSWLGVLKVCDDDGHKIKPYQVNSVTNMRGTLLMVFFVGLCEH